MVFTVDQSRIFARFAECSASVADAADFSRLVKEEVRPLLPHGMLFAAIGRFSFEHLEVHGVLAVDFPDGFLTRLAPTFNIRQRPVIRRWLAARRPLLVDPVLDRGVLSPMELAEIEAFGLGRLAVHGQPDLSGNMGSYFSFAQVPPALPSHEVEYALSLICPLLHGALIRIPDLGVATVNPLAGLTEIEHQLLIWLAAGRSNSEMARLRDRSPATIRNQLEKLYEKLGVGTRAEAAALAISRGINSSRQTT